MPEPSEDPWEVTTPEDFLAPFRNATDEERSRRFQPHKRFEKRFGRTGNSY